MSESVRRQEPPDGFTNDTQSSCKLDGPQRDRRAELTFIADD
jgi:hypothetical protein